MRNLATRYLASFAAIYIVLTVWVLVGQNMFGWVMTRFILCGLGIALLMTLVFIVARRIKRYDIIDVAWGLSFMVAAGVSYSLQPGIVLEWDIQTLITLLVIIWGGRLSIHILWRLIKSKQEDPRYKQLRKNWRTQPALNMYVRVYLMQALLALFISVSVIHINLFADVAWNPLAIIGTLVWSVGFSFESISDLQLSRFINNPTNKGKLMTRGLWKYSRHPNYFGELTQWWGIFVISLGIPFGWVGVIGPLLLSYLIIFVSGIPLVEKRFRNKSGWLRYKNQTSPLVPLPVRVK